MPHANGAILFHASHGFHFGIKNLTTLCTAAEELALKEGTIKDDAICLYARQEALHPPRLLLENLVSR